MDSNAYLPGHVNHLFEKWANHMGLFSKAGKRIDYLKKELPVLLKDRQFFIDILKNIQKGSPYPDIRHSGLFQNEIILFLNTSPLFSVRIAMYEPGEYTIIHDHSSWGVFGTVYGLLEVIKYARIDDGSKNHYAKLSETSRLILKPCEPDFTLPLDNGIHQIGNPTGNVILTASIYGNPIRRLFINQFDLKNHRVHPVYSPKIKKRKQAKQVLKLLLPVTL